MSNPAPRSELLKYIGPQYFHDASIVRIDRSEQDLDVILKVEGNCNFRIRFFNVQQVQSNRPEGMVLYAVAELRASKPGRCFSFINWHEKDDAGLEITATNYATAKI